MRISNDTKLRDTVIEVIRQMTNEIADLKSVTSCKHTVSALTWYRRKLRTAVKSRPRNCEKYATLSSALAAWREQPPSVGPFDNWLFDYVKESEVTK